MSDNEQHHNTLVGQNIFKTRITIGMKLVDEGKLIHLNKDQPYKEPIFLDPATNYQFSGKIDLDVASQEIKILKRIARNQPYKIEPIKAKKITLTPHEAAQSFKANFDKTYGQQFTLQSDIAHSKDFPEVKLKIMNPRNKEQVSTQMLGFEKDIRGYSAALLELEKAGIKRDERQEGIFLSHEPTGLERKVSGNFKQVMRICDAFERQVNAKTQQLAKQNQPNKQAMDTKRQQLQPAIKEAPLATDEMPQSAYAAEEGSAEMRTYAQHDTIYSGPIHINPHTRVAILDTGILMRCFGEAGNDHQAVSFGEAVFDSLLQNPAIDNIIIPDYIADIESGGRTTSYEKDGHINTTFIRSKSMPGGEYFRPRVEAMLARAIRRHVNDDGSVDYLRDSQIDSKDINPKIIIWESPHGERQTQHFLQNRRDNEQVRDGGEKVIDALAADPTFRDCKKLILTTDSIYARGDSPFDLKDIPNTCRANLGHYLQNLIIRDIGKWSDICAFSSSQDEDHNLPRIVMDIRSAMRTRFNAAMPEQSQQDFTPTSTICDNPLLFSELTGLTSVNKAYDQKHIVRAMRVIPNANSKLQSRQQS